MKYELPSTVPSVPARREPPGRQTIPNHGETFPV